MGTSGAWPGCRDAVGSMRVRMPAPVRAADMRRYPAFELPVAPWR